MKTHREKVKHRDNTRQLADRNISMVVTCPSGTPALKYTQNYFLSHSKLDRNLPNEHHAVLMNTLIKKGNVHFIDPTVGKL